MFVYVTMLWTVLVTRVHEARDTEGKTRGASAIEWAIIAGVSVVLAAVVGGVIYNIVSSKTNDLNNCGTADTAHGKTC